MDKEVLAAIGSGIALILGGGATLLHRQHKAMKAQIEAKEGVAIFDKKMTEAAGDIVKQLREQNEWLQKQLTQSNVDIDKVRQEYKELKAKFDALDNAEMQKVLAENATLKQELAEIRQKFEQTERELTALMRRIVSAESQAQKFISSD